LLRVTHRTNANENIRNLYYGRYFVGKHDSTTDRPSSCMCPDPIGPVARSAGPRCEATRTGRRAREVRRTLGDPIGPNTPVAYVVAGGRQRDRQLIRGDPGGAFCKLGRCQKIDVASRSRLLLLSSPTRAAEQTPTDGTTGGRVETRTEAYVWSGKVAITGDFAS